MDEPTASLDPDIADKVRQTLLTLQRERGLTLIYTSHNMREIELMCQQVLFLARGRLLAAGSPGEVLASSGQASLEEFFISHSRQERPGGEA